MSQNVFKHTLHCTRFLPVAGFMNCVPKFNGKLGDPHCLFVGVDGFLPGRILDCLGVLRDSLSRLKLRALCEFSSPSSSSSLFVFALKTSALDGDLLPVDIEVFIKPEKEDATKPAAAKEFTDAATMAAAEWAKEAGGGGGGGGKQAGMELLLRFKPIGSLSESLLRSGLTLDGKLARLDPNFR